VIDRWTGDPSTLEILASRLREARQARGLSLATFAEQIFLKPEALEALEAGDRTRLPSGLHLIEQVRWVASNLDLNVEPLLEPLRDEPTVPGEPTADPGRPAPAPVPAKRPDGVRAGPLLAAMAVALGGGALLLWRGQPRTLAPAAGTPATARGSSRTAAATSVLMLSSSEPSWLEIRTPSGVVIFEGLLEGKATFALGAGLEVLAGRPDLVKAAVGSRREEPLGPIERVTWYRFASDGRRLPDARP
jgi:transcriptional regulator with XRE-family HTH domain